MPVRNVDTDDEIWDSLASLQGKEVVVGTIANYYVEFTGTLLFFSYERYQWRVVHGENKVSFNLEDVGAVLVYNVEKEKMPLILLK